MDKFEVIQGGGLSKEVARQEAPELEIIQGCRISVEETKREPNFMYRPVLPVTREMFRQDPDLYTEEMERLGAKHIKAIKARGGGINNIRSAEEGAV